MCYLTTHSTKYHSDSERGNPLPPHGLLFRLTARVLLYAPSHKQDSTYHSLCYTSRGALAGTRNSFMGPPHEGSIRRSITPWVNALTMELHLAPRFSLLHELFTMPIWTVNTFCLGQKGWPRSEIVPTTSVHYKSFLWMCTLNPYR